MTGKQKQERFINKAKQLFGEKYDYSKVEYVNHNTKVCIICPEHGDFYITPSSFLFSSGCAMCNHQEKFIRKAKEIHGDKFDYSKVHYTGTNEKVCIICPEHGEFYQTPQTHLNTKHSCPQCEKKSIKQQLSDNTESFVEKAKKIHGNTYDYSKVNYIDNNTKVCVVCKKHGDFFIRPFNHLSNRYGCPKCLCEEKQAILKHNFVNKAKELYGEDQYDYSNVDYVNSHTPLTIKCKSHGDFIIKPYHFLNGFACPACQNRSTKDTNFEYLKTKKFIEDSKKTHGDAYLYDKSVYVDSTTPVIVTCKKHGDFLVDPSKHRHGKCPCLRCLHESQIIYTFDVCKDIAEQCKTIMEFRAKNQTAYYRSVHNKWIDSFDWLSTIDNNLKSQSIYVYEFPNKTIYVGLTNNPTRRDVAHRKETEENKSSVFEYARNHNIDIPEMKIIECGLTRQESKERECYWIEYYKQNNYSVLNKIKGGGLGGNIKIHEITDDEIISFAKTCKHKEEMRRKNRPLYNNMMERNLKQVCFPNGRSFVMSPKRTYSEEYIKSEISKYNNRKDLRKSDYTLYMYLWKHNMLYDFFDSTSGSNITKNQL